MLSWLAQRLLDGMMEEELCWKIHTNLDNHTVVATDISRYTRTISTLLDLPSTFESTTFDGEDAYETAKAYVRWRIARAGLLHMIKLWKREP